MVKLLRGRERKQTNLAKKMADSNGESGKELSIHIEKV